MLLGCWPSCLCDWWVWGLIDKYKWLKKVWKISTFHAHAMYTDSLKHKPMTDSPWLAIYDNHGFEPCSLRLRLREGCCARFDDRTRSRFLWPSQKKQWSSFMILKCIFLLLLHGLCRQRRSHLSPHYNITPTLILRWPRSLLSGHVMKRRSWRTSSWVLIWISPMLVQGFKCDVFS